MKGRGQTGGSPHDCGPGLPRQQCRVRGPAPAGTRARAHGAPASRQAAQSPRPPPRRAGVYPQSVKSPVVILSHHLVTAVYMLIPYHYPQYQWCMAACMTVEVGGRRGGRRGAVACVPVWSTTVTCRPPLVVRAAGVLPALVGCACALPPTPTGPDRAAPLAQTNLPRSTRGSSLRAERSGVP